MNTESTNLYDCIAHRGLKDTNLLTYAIALSFVNILPTLIAIFGNAICIYALIKTPSLRRISNIWVGALCIGDITVGILGQAFFYASLVLTITGKGANVLWLISRNVSMFLANTSLYIVYFVTMDRYIAICHSSWYVKVVKKRWCIFGTALGFLLSIPAVIVNIFASSAIVVYLIVLYLLIVSQIILFYCRIYTNIRRQRKHVSSVDGALRDKSKFRRRIVDARRAHTIGNIVVLMLILYCPISVVVMIFGYTTANDICSLSEKAVVAIAWGQFFVFLISSVKPVIYCFQMHDIRFAIRRLFRGKKRSVETGLRTCIEAYVNNLSMG